MQSKRIGIITYDAPHRKTQDLVMRLRMRGYDDLTLLATPFVKREPRRTLYQHRPEPLQGDVAQMVRTVTRCRVDEIADIIKFAEFENPFDTILIAGAGLLPDALVEQHRIINAHPGYLPYARGLDAFKWALYHKLPIGVTTHFINTEPDAGVLIDRKFVPIYFSDTFHSVAMRIYDTELDMLIDAITAKPIGEKLETTTAVFKRMPVEREVMMIQRFEQIRNCQNWQ